MLPIPSDYNDHHISGEWQDHPDGIGWLAHQSIDTNNPAFLSSDHGWTSDANTFEEFFDFSRYAGLPDEAVVGCLSGMVSVKPTLPTVHEQSAFEEDVNPALQKGFGSSLQSISSPATSLSSFIPNTSSSGSPVYDPPEVPESLLVVSHKCPQCYERFGSEALVAKHQATKHPARLLDCGLPGCNKSFADPRSLQRHLTTTRKHQTITTPVYKCHCNASRPRWDKFKEHLRDCRFERTASSRYICICGNTSQRINELEIHKKNCHPDKRGRPRKVREIARKESH